MRGSLAIRTPVDTSRLDMSSTHVTTGAYVTITASLAAGVSAMEIFNPSASTMKIAVGAAGSEVDMKYSVIPGGSAFLIPLPAGGGKRISLKAVDADATSGIFTINYFG